MVGRTAIRARALLLVAVAGVGCLTAACNRDGERRRSRREANRPCLVVPMRTERVLHPPVQGGKGRR